MKTIISRHCLMEFISTFFYVGKLPFAPGTAGSFAGLLLYLCFLNHSFICVLVFILILVLGFFSSAYFEKALGIKDPKQIVIDEVAGIFIVYFFIPPQLFYIVVGFLIYRALDILKPFFIRRMERLNGGFGIMGDDILCGIYTNLILQFLWRFLRLSFS